MRISRHVLSLFVVILAAGSWGTENPNWIVLQTGNWNGRYFYPASELTYVSKFFWRKEYRIRIGLRAFGSPYLFANGIYEAPLCLERAFSRERRIREFFVGGGVAPWLRLPNGPEFHAQPFLLAGAEARWKRAGLILMAKSRFYNDGVRFDLVPMLGVKAFRGLGFLVQPKLSFLSRYNLERTDRRLHVFAGLGYSFNRQSRKQDEIGR